MSAARRKAAAGAALFSLAVVLAAPRAASAQQSTPACGGPAAESAMLAAPMAPWKGAPLRVILTIEAESQGELSLISPDGNVAAKSRERHGGPPYFWYAEVPSPAPGKWQARLVRDGAPSECATVTRDITVAKSKPGSPGLRQGTVWPVRGEWTRASEALYSAWIEKLFDAPLDAAPSWKALHEVLRDRSRNVLHNYLGARDDEIGMIVRPDCADLPYFLRAYFAFKMGLPYGYAKCTRGGGGQAPKCYQWWNIQKEEPPPLPPGEEAAYEASLHQQKPGQPQPQPPPKKQGGDFFDSLFGGPQPKPQAPPPGQKKLAGKQAPPQTQAPKLPPKPQSLVPMFGWYLENAVANGVHSGNGRTAAADDETDYYPVPLSADQLRPGTVYADPYGHLLVIARRVAQTGDSAGVLLAVDGQPDGTVARKRFWRGNFLFAQDPGLGSPGFKRLRPIVRARDGGLRRLTNTEIRKSPDYGDFSLDQSKMGIEAFYDRMDDVLSPAPLDPARAMLEAVTALDEQVRARVTSVENGRKYHLKGGRDVDMPDGPQIFETTGAWEDFATPSRDLRLLIAIDVVKGFPDRVARRPERYAMPAGKSPAEVKAELEALLAAEMEKRSFTYPRTDGSEWKLTLKDVLARSPDLEMAYNLNDCVELRWGAGEGSEEAATCKRRASAAQRTKMASVRAWFSERRRPPRG